MITRHPTGDHARVAPTRAPGTVVDVKLRRDPDPVTRAADRAWAGVEAGRREAFMSHQVLCLAGRHNGESAWTPPVAVLGWVREQVRAALGRTPGAGPKDWGWQGYAYHGVALVDVFDDDRPLLPDEVASFTPQRPEPARYYAYQDLLLEESTGRWYPAPGLEEELLALLIPHVGQDALNRLPRKLRRRLAG